MNPTTRLALAVSTALAMLAGCGDDDMPRFDGGPTYPPASVVPQVAFEGHERMIVEVTASGADLSAATIESEDPSVVEVLEQRCRGTRCGVVLRIRDTRANTGSVIPATIDAQNQFLRITNGGEMYRGLLGVRPLDTIANGGASPLMVRSNVFASSADTVAGSTFRGVAGAAPVRWIIFGGATLRGTIDVSGEGASGGAGGANGGAASASGEGASGGAAGAGGAGAGGGGAREDGLAGDAADGTPEGGGAGGAGEGTADTACTTTFEAEACGGSGGGGAAGEGGAGGGTLVIAALGPLDLSGATVLSRGADGVEGGGGGGGGNVLVASPALTATGATFDAAGGAGGAQTGGGAGGAGGRGRIRVDAPGVALDPLSFAGPAVDLSAVPALSDAPTITFAGRAAPSASVSIYEVDDEATTFDATADATTGAFSVEVTLRPGLNRLAVRAEQAGVTVRSWVGTSFELEQIPELRLALPRGALIDVVYLP